MDLNNLVVLKLNLKLFIESSNIFRNEIKRKIKCKPLLQHSGSFETIISKQKIARAFFKHINILINPLFNYNSTIF